MQPANSPVYNLAAAPPLCSECGNAMRVELIRHISKGRVSSFKLNCDTCKYACAADVQYLNVQHAKYQKPAPVDGGQLVEG